MCFFLSNVVLNAKIFGFDTKILPLNPWIEVHNSPCFRGGVGFDAFEGQGL